MTKNHFKRIRAPRTWPIARKEDKFIVRPNPGAHNFELSLPINVVIKDLLNLAKTTKEVKIMLNKQEILVDGKKVKEHKLPVGFLDVISFPLTKKAYRITINNKGKLDIIELKDTESKLKACKIIGKTLLKKNKIQINLNDSKNIFVEKDNYKVGDTLIIEVPSQKIVDHIKFDKNASIILVGGKHIGKKGSIEEIKENKIIYKNNEGENRQTLKKYAFVIGKEKPSISI